MLARHNESQANQVRCHPAPEAGKLNESVDGSNLTRDRTRTVDSYTCSWLLCAAYVLAASEAALVPKTGALAAAGSEQRQRSKGCKWDKPPLRGSRSMFFDASTIRFSLPSARLVRHFCIRARKPIQLGRLRRREPQSREIIIIISRTTIIPLKTQMRDEAFQ